MKSQLTFRDILDIMQRRKVYLVVPFLLIAIISTIGAFILPERYESYTTILLKKDDILNPLVSVQMGVAMAQGDELTLFNEILYSRSTLHTLLDSLGMLSSVRGEEQLDDLISATRRKITTAQHGSESFRITVADANPGFTQRAAATLSRLYIQTSLKSERQQNEDAVRFFERKVREYSEIFEAQQKDVLSAKQGRLSSLPQGDETLKLKYDRIDAELRDAERDLTQQQQTGILLQRYIDDIDNPGTISQISALDPQGAVLYISELKALSVKYNDLISRYTPRYPEVQSLRQQLLSLLRKSSEALNAEIDRTTIRRNRVSAQRDDVLQSISQSYALTEASTERQSNYSIYKQMYDDMKVKLEQARVAKDLGERGESKYVILDPARMPTKPTKPNRQVIIGSGVGLGIVIGIATMFLGEYLDPTIRRRRDIEVFQKPIIAYLP